MVTGSTVTLRHIAADIGVSAATVSYVLNGRRLDRISPETQQRVLDAAQRHGYRPNELARAVVTGKSRVIGVLMHDNGQDMYVEHVSAMLAGAFYESGQRGYATKVLQLPFLATREELEVILQRCSSWRLDGIIAVSLHEKALGSLKSEMKSLRAPVAYIEGGKKQDDEGNSIRVATDDYNGIYNAVEHLRELGHRRITLLAGPSDRELSGVRNGIFLEVMKKLELPITEHSVVQSHWSNPDLAEQSVHYVLDLPQRPTALLCAGDIGGMVAMRTARRRGFSVPEDLSVIGFGNLALSAHSDPPLTTISQSFRLMGQVAMKHLLNRLDNENGEEKAIDELIHASLMVRESTAPPPF